VPFGCDGVVMVQAALRGANSHFALNGSLTLI
jgi:hypothetical protein